MTHPTRRQLLLSMAATGLSTLAHGQAERAGKSHPSANGSTIQGTDPARREALMGVLGELPVRPHPALRVLESMELEGGRRDKVEFLAEGADPLFATPADKIRAYLFVPERKNGERLPAVIAIHQDGPQSHIGKSEPAGLAGDKNLHYGLELFQRGYVVLCPDRFEHAERRRTSPSDITSIDPQRDDDLLNHWVGQLLLRGRSMMGKEAYDLMVAADILQSLEYVDRDRIGAIGHSAGGNALVYFMFADPRIRVGVSSCGLFDMLRFFREDAPKRRMAAIAIPGLAKVGDSADYLALIAPRPVLLTRGLWEWGTDGDDARFSKSHVQETRDMEARARADYARLGASSELQAVYFDEAGGNHDFPPQVRQAAYRFIDENLKRSG